MRDKGSIAGEIDERLDKLTSELTSKVGTKKRSEYHTARKLAWLRARRSPVAVVN